MFSNNDYHNEHSSWFSSLDSNVVSVLDNTPSMRGGSMMDYAKSMHDTYGDNYFSSRFSVDGNDNQGGLFSSWWDKAMNEEPIVRETISPSNHPVFETDKKCSTTEYLSAIKDGCIDKVATKETMTDVKSSMIAGAVIGGALGGIKGGPLGGITGGAIGAATKGGEAVVKSCARGSFETIEKRCGTDSKASEDGGSYCIIS